MLNDHLHDLAMSNVNLLSPPGAPDEEAAAEVDEPPDDSGSRNSQTTHFRRNTIRKPADRSVSLLTKAIQHSESETVIASPVAAVSTRRRSMASNISIASTAELTSDTGLTSPARTNTPSPPPPSLSFARLDAALIEAKPQTQVAVASSLNSGDMTTAKDPAVEALAKKRCISFACGPKPVVKPAAQPQPSVQQAQAPAAEAVEKPAPRRTCIKFACPAKPTSAPSVPKKESVEGSAQRKTARQSPVSGHQRSPSFRGHARRSSTPRPLPQFSSRAQPKKYLTASGCDLASEASRFHEIASDEPQQEDWIRLNFTTPYRLTIGDTLRKENEIRRLGKEAEEEALEEEEEEEDDADVEEAAEDDGEEDEDDEEDDEEEEEDEEEDEGDDSLDIDEIDEGSDHDILDGYKTDSEMGFAESDDDDADSEDLLLWIPSSGFVRPITNDTPLKRRASLSGNKSDSSTSSQAANDASPKMVRGRKRHIKIQPGTPELPDSTDFVCGTLDEDRALEDAYISCIEERRRGKTHLIPQDIDPSFPTSEPEDEEAEPTRAGADSDDDEDFIHGQLEDIHHEQNRGLERRKSKGGQKSPMRLRSPPPKRHSSPPPKNRGRSPRRVSGKQSPRKMLSPPPRGFKKSPAGSVISAEIPGAKAGLKTLAFRPGLTNTKSLPRAPAMFPGHIKAHRRGKLAHHGHEGHVRGAIDIVKGLEQKRQRRKEKFREKHFQKHCNKARKGQVPEKKTQPGKGAERMREIGLLMAGKRPQGQFVLSV